MLEGIIIGAILGIGLNGAKKQLKKLARRYRGCDGMVFEIY